MANTRTIDKPELGVTIEELFSEGKSIVLYNDDHNTFDHVISCLVQYCGHTDSQAEQCALIVHTKGKCSVKNGGLEELKPIHEALLENGLTDRKSVV